jgi:hypothetical protein
MREFCCWAGKGHLDLNFFSSCRLQTAQQHTKTKQTIMVAIQEGLNFTLNVALEISQVPVGGLSKPEYAQ